MCFTSGPARGPDCGYSSRMPDDTPRHDCPDCGDPLAFTFHSTSGVGAHKRGDHYNTTPDTRHYACFACAKAWKQRLDGPLTPDVIGELTLFTCPDHSCGSPMTATTRPDDPAGIRLACRQGHGYRVTMSDGEVRLVADA
jgi:hypothetical protein